MKIGKAVAAFSLLATMAMGTLFGQARTGFKYSENKLNWIVVQTDTFSKANGGYSIQTQTAKLSKQFPELPVSVTRAIDGIPHPYTSSNTMGNRVQEAGRETYFGGLIKQHFEIE